MIKILICSLTYSLPNGVTVSINTSIDGFNKKGIKSLVVSPDYDIGEIRKEHRLVPSSLILKNIGLLIGKKERTFGLGSYNQIKKIDNELRPDIYWLHTITWTANTFEQIMFKSKKPKVVFYHTMVEEYGRIYAGTIGAAIMKKRSKIVCNKSNAVIVPSEMMKKKLVKYGVKTPIHIIPTGIVMPEKQLSKKEICERFNINPDSKILLYVGRVSKEKNLEILLRVTKKVNENGIDATLLFVGPGDTKEIAKDAKRLGIGDKAVFTGGLPKVEAQSFYAGCDAFVFSSQTETQGLVIGEAMISGIPIIALKSSIQEEVYPEGTAIVVCNLSEFVEKLTAILKGEGDVLKMVQNAKDFVEKKFSEKSMIEKQIRLFKDLIVTKE